MRRSLTLLAALALLAAAAPASAQDAGAGSDSTLTVEGQATVSSAPEVATFSVGIETNDRFAATAQARSNALYSGVRAALAKAGVPDSAVKSSSYFVRYVPPPQPIRPAPPPGPTQPAVPPGNLRHTESIARMPVNLGEVFGYFVSRNLSVTVDPDRVGGAIDACVRAGATDIGSVSFDLRDRRAAWNQALSAAVADADAQANALASTGRLRIVRLKSIQAGSPPFNGGPVMFARTAGPGTDIPPSNVDISASASVTYVIAPKP